MSIETARLLIRPLALTDLADAHAILSDPITMRFWPRPLTRDEAHAWIERSISNHARLGIGSCAVLSRETATIIGICGISPLTIVGAERNDLGYIIDHRLHGGGYATEACTAILHNAFTVAGIDSAHANMPHDHFASSRVAEKLGMRRIAEFANGRNRGIRTLLYEITRAEWMARRAAGPA